MEKEVILITSYCNTPLKQCILDNCINYIKSKYPDLDIALNSNSVVPKFDDKLVKHFFYNEDNIIIPKEEKLFNFYCDVTTIVGKPAVLKSIALDSALSAFQQWQCITDLYELGYDNVHIINYDTDVYGGHLDFLITTNRQKFSEGYEVIANENKMSNGIDFIAMGIKSKCYTEKIRYGITKESYLKVITDSPEQYIKRLFYSLDLKIHNLDMQFTDLYASSQFFEYPAIISTIWVGIDMQNDKKMIYLAGYKEIIKSVTVEVDEGVIVSVDNQYPFNVILFEVPITPKYLKIKKINHSKYDSVVIPQFHDSYWINNFIEYP